MRRTLLIIALALPATLAAQSAAPSESRDGVMFVFDRFAGIFGGWLIAAFDSIPADRYGYRPTPAQYTVGYIAQHVENANYGLCERLGTLKHSRTAKDSLADTAKARWPKDTLVARLKASLAFCDTAIGNVTRLESASHANTLLGFQTDLAEHYSQIAVYMRLLGMIPPSALAPKKHVAIELPASALPSYVGVYRIGPGFQLDVTIDAGALFVKSSAGGPAVRLWPERTDEFFVNEVDAQLTFTRDGTKAVTGLILHQFGRDRPAKKIL